MPARNSGLHHADFELVRPTTKLKNSFLDGLREFQAEGLAWHLKLDAAAIDADFDAFVSRESASDHRHSDHHVLETVLWGVWKGEYAGRIAIRHELTDALRVLGGHIGYDTRPSLRGLGIASRMLEGAIPIARGLGLSKVLLTCDDTNSASIRVIEKNGGTLECKKQLALGHPAKRYYWISL